MKTSLNELVAGEFFIVTDGDLIACKLLPGWGDKSRMLRPGQDSSKIFMVRSKNKTSINLSFTYFFDNKGEISGWVLDRRFNLSENQHVKIKTLNNAL